MSSKQPPVPPANRSDKGPQGKPAAAPGKELPPVEENPEERGRHANLKQNIGAMQKVR